MNATSRPQCLTGTRADILQSLIRDLTAPSPEANVIWLSGVAGAGKSTIATTIAELLRGWSQLGAFLFFDRNSPTQSGPDGVIRTLAYQLALSVDTLTHAICEAIEKDSQIITRPLTSQFNDLLLAPLRACLPNMKTPVIVVLDAFDECGDAHSRRALLNLLSEHLPLLPRHIRFLITGRPELDLNGAFRSRSGVKSVSLSASGWSSRADVLLYIQHEMAKLYQMRQWSDELPPGWPGISRIQQLGGRANDSFIWAATVMRYLQSADDVDESLHRLLTQTAFTLDDLYATALRSATSWDPSEISTEYCRKILGAVVVGRVAPTDDMIIEILGLQNSKSCRLVLRRLACLLQWSEGSPIRTLHASFADYLTDGARCGGKPWFIDQTKYHLEFAAGCLRVMEERLCFNICGLETSHLMNRDVPNLAKRIKDFIPPFLAYACRFWAEHISRAGAMGLRILPQILKFFQLQFLYWLEILSLIGESRVALPSINIVQTLSKVSSAFKRIKMLF